MQVIKYINKHKNLIFLFALLAIASYLRLHKISEYLTFLGDEGRDVLVVKKMIVDHKFTLLGPTASVGGFFLGPLYYYLMLPFLWIWQLDPTGPAVMVALFGIGTVYLIYKTAKEVFSPIVGIAASSLYALSPLVISYSRSSWNPNLVPFFSLLLFYLLWKIMINPGKHDLFWVGILLGTGIQLHYLFLFLYLIVFIWILILKFVTKLKIIDYLKLFIGFIIGNSMFILFEVRHGFPNSYSIINFLLKGEETGFQKTIFFSNLQNVIGRLYGRLLIRMPDGAMLAGMPSNQRDLWNNGVFLFGLVISAFLLWQLYSKRKYLTFLKIPKTGINKIQVNNAVGLSLLCIWLIVPLVLFGFYNRSIYDYYFGLMYFVPFMLIGLLLDFIYRKRHIKYLSIVILLLLLYYNWQGRPFIYPPNNQLEQMKNISRKAMDVAGNDPFNFALVTAQNSDHAYRYFFEIWGNPPVTIENSQIDPDRESVMDQLIVICEDPACQPLGHPLWEIAGFGSAEIVGSWEVPFVKIFKLISYN
ncbi:ArnT family glycosyltransferase [Patescibacteria group bacterium]